MCTVINIVVGFKLVGNVNEYMGLVVVPRKLFSELYPIEAKEKQNKFANYFS